MAVESCPIEARFIQTYHACMVQMSQNKPLAKSSTLVIQKSPVVSVDFDTTDMSGYDEFKAYAVGLFSALICSGLHGKTLVFDEVKRERYGTLKIRLV